MFKKLTAAFIAITSLSFANFENTQAVSSNQNEASQASPQLEKDFKEFKIKEENKFKDFTYFKVNALYGFWPQIGVGHRTVNGHDFSASFSIIINNLSYQKLFYQKPKNTKVNYFGIGPSIELLGIWPIPCPKVSFGQQYFEKTGKFFQVEASFPFSFGTSLDFSKSKKYSIKNWMPFIYISMGF